MTAVWSAVAATALTFFTGVIIHRAVAVTRAARSRRRLIGHDGVGVNYSRPPWIGIRPAHFGWGTLWLVAAVLLIKAGPMLALLALAVAMVGHRMTDSWLEDRRRQAYEAALPEFLDNLNRSLYSGAGLLAAFADASQRTTGQLANDLDLVLRRCSLGAGLFEALAGWQASHPSTSVRLCVGALTLAMETGGSPARAIDSASVTVRQALVARDLARTYATEARASAMALTILPLVISGPVLLTNSDAREFLFFTGLGQVCLSLGLGLSAMGAYSMSFLVRKVLP